MNWRTHAISFGVFIFALGIIKLIWNNPQIILYVILGVIALLGYGAVYIIVKAKLEKKKE